MARLRTRQSRAAGAAVGVWSVGAGWPSGRPDLRRGGSAASPHRFKI